MGAKLVDTNVFIDFFRGHPPAIVFFKNNKELCFSAITEAELFAGKENNDPQRYATLVALLQQWEKLPVDNPLVRTAGDLCRTRGMNMADAVIAATALHAGATLLTRNVKHFKNVPRLTVKSPY